MPEISVHDAHERVLTAALRVLRAERDPASDPYVDAEHEYACEQLAHAARTLTRATGALPPGQQPTGWTEGDRP